LGVENGFDVSAVDKADGFDVMLGLLFIMSFMIFSSIFFVVFDIKIALQNHNKYDFVRL
jgi:hypothetical protein